jgi:hypothetical protein
MRLKELPIAAVVAGRVFIGESMQWLTMWLETHLDRIQAEVGLRCRVLGNISQSQLI